MALQVVGVAVWSCSPVNWCPADVLHFTAPVPELQAEPVTFTCSCLTATPPAHLRALPPLFTSNTPLQPVELAITGWTLNWWIPTAAAPSFTAYVVRGGAQHIYFHHHPTRYPHLLHHGLGRGWMVLKHSLYPIPALPPPPACDYPHPPLPPQPTAMALPDCYGRAHMPRCGPSRPPPPFYLRHYGRRAVAFPQVPGWGGGGAWEGAWRVVRRCASDDAPPARWIGSGLH